MVVHSFTVVSIVLIVAVSDAVKIKSHNGDELEDHGQAQKSNACSQKDVLDAVLNLLEMAQAEGLTLAQLKNNIQNAKAVDVIVDGAGLSSELIFPGQNEYITRMTNPRSSPSSQRGPLRPEETSVVEKLDDRAIDQVMSNKTYGTLDAVEYASSSFGAVPKPHPSTMTLTFHQGLFNEAKGQLGLTKQMISDDAKILEEPPAGLLHRLVGVGYVLKKLCYTPKALQNEKCWKGPKIAHAPTKGGLFSKGGPCTDCFRETMPEDGDMKQHHVPEKRLYLEFELSEPEPQVEMSEADQGLPPPGLSDAPPPGQFEMSGPPGAGEMSGPPGAGEMSGPPGAGEMSGPPGAGDEVDFRGFES